MMTERCIGWNRDSSYQISPDAYCHLEESSYIASPSSTFTTINHGPSLGVVSRQPSTETEKSSQGTSKHPPALAQYLGLGKYAIENSHLDQLITVSVTSPPSPGENIIPKRKRAGERVAKEIQRTLKRPKSLSENENDHSDGYMHVNVVEPLRQQTGRRQAFTTATAKVHKLYQLSQFDTITDIASSENELFNTPQTDTTSYASNLQDSSRAQKGHILREQSGGCRDIVPLVKPTASIDKSNNLGWSQYGPKDIASAAIPEPQMVTNTMRTRRAPSTGQPLYAIREQPSVEVESDRQASPSSSTIFDFCTTQSQTRIRFQGASAVVSSSSLIKTSTESFPPVKRRHAIFNAHLNQDVIEDTDAFSQLDETDLLQLECCAVAGAITDLHNDTTLSSLPKKQLSVDLPIPAASEDPLLDAVNEDKFLQLSDVGAEVVHLTNQPHVSQQDERLMESEHELILKHARSTLHAHGSKQAPEEGSETEQTSSPSPHPFARPVFPNHIPDRSPLLNIVQSLTLKTCFRTGEAINIGARYSRETSTSTSDGILIELYARVVSSWRPASHSGCRQDFILADLWSKRGPQIHGYWTGWRGSNVFDADARTLLTDIAAESNAHAKLCRLIGRMKREKQRWVFVVLSAWKCHWDDIEYIRGIVCYE